jgi:hypothetical protein
LFFILPHFTAFHKDRNADYLMAVAVVHNPLFDKFHNLSLDDSAEQLKAIDVSQTAGENIVPTEEVPRRAKALRSADFSKRSQTVQKEKKHKVYNANTTKQELESVTASGRITRSSTRNQ